MVVINLIESIKEPQLKTTITYSTLMYLKLVEMGSFDNNRNPSLRDHGISILIALSNGFSMNKDIESLIVGYCKEIFNSLINHEYIKVVDSKSYFQITQKGLDFLNSLSKQYSINMNLYLSKALLLDEASIDVIQCQDKTHLANKLYNVIYGDNNEDYKKYKEYIDDQVQKLFELDSKMQEKK